jgi:hypothetical protein
MEIIRHSRVIDAKNKQQVESYMKYLWDLTFRYRYTGDIFVSIKSEDGSYTALEESNINKRYTRDALHRCLFFSRPSFKILCTIRVVTK